MLYTLLFTILSFFSGSVMYSYLFGKWFAKKDIRLAHEDRNPGAMNAFRMAGTFIGTLSLLFDFAKGAVPVAFAKYYFHFDDFSLSLISIAPILGHGFSPLLKFKGGKAIAVSYGVWVALTLWEIPIVWGISTLLWQRISGKDHLSVLLAMFITLFYLLFIKQDLYLSFIAAIDIFILTVRGWNEIKSSIRVPQINKKI